MFTKVLLAVGLASLAQAQSYHPPGNNTFGALYTPDGAHPVTQGEVALVTWDATGHTTDGTTISLVLCHGNSANCVPSSSAIVSNVPATVQSYSWSVPCSLAAGVANTDTGYGMLIISDQTGDFQYSTQFSVLSNPQCGNAPTMNSTTPAATGSMPHPTHSSSSTWSAHNNYTHTTNKPTYHQSTAIMQTTPPVMTYASATYSATPSQFTGAATKIGGSAAALVMAAGAAFFAL